MKKLFTLISACLVSFYSVQAQCDLDFTFTNTGTNMTAFFTPAAAAAIYGELGAGTVGAFYMNTEGEYVCAASVEFTGSQIQLAVMADDATTPAKDGFSPGEAMTWFYQSNDGAVSELGLTPADNFVINGMSFISAASITSVDCGGSDDQCPALETDVVNTGTNMTMFLTPDGADAISVLGNGTIAVYYSSNGELICGGTTSFSGSQTSFPAMADDATTPSKDGFSAGETIVWKFEDNNGNQYDLTPSPANTFVTNGISFITGFTYTAISCAVDVEGCTDPMYLEYNPSATIDDGSCATIKIEGCTDENYLEYNPNANVDNGSCVTLSVEGCTNSLYVEYNPIATVDDGSCATLIVEGCTDESYMEYNPDANTNDGSCATLIVEGCTDDSYVEYNADANVDNGSCATLIVEGCTDANATNYNSDANTNDGSCEYDLVGAGCDVDFSATNTGSNHTIMIPGSVTSQLSTGDQIGVFFIASSGQAMCAGSSTWTGQNVQIVAYGDDTTTPEVDGLSAGAPFLFMAQSGDNVYMVDAEFQSPSMANYSVNGLSFVTGLNFELACTVEYLGCTDANACNYDSTANTDDGSCTYAEVNLDCSGNCLSDVDGDGICDQNEIYGCTDANSSNYDANATEEDGSCVSWEDAYNDCVEAGGDDGVTQEDVDVVQALLDEANDEIVVMNGAISDLEGQLADALANQEDGVSQEDLDELQAQIDVYEQQVSNLSASIAELEAQLEVALANQEDGVTQADLDAANFEIAELEAQIDEILANCGDDGVTQADVDAVQELLDQANADLEVALANQEDGVSQEDVDEVQALLDEALLNQEDGVTQLDVDAVQADLDIANMEIVDLQAQLEEALSNGGSGGGSCDPIYIELLAGWNIIGYTLPVAQDVAATMASIVEDVQIVKNNAAQVYWPEYGFNGIGDYIPGQGYQIRMLNGISSYTLPNVGGQRIEMTPMVPDWVHDLPVMNHPNDIRTLVKVVNMLGQEVDVEQQFKGEILLYLYNDGTTEKRIVE
jgi:hypothetical protein